jgi:succinate-semialdehyde dehydrogenase/glutarate-semialdehyde dehydrogenase
MGTNAPPTANAEIPPADGYRQPAMLIDGVWIEAAADRKAVTNPATEEALAWLPHASLGDLDRALAAAQRSFAAWSATSAERRSEIIFAAADLLRDRIAPIALALTLENGKPLSESRAEVLRTAAFLDWEAAEARRAYGTLVPGEPGFSRMAQRIPIGPVAAFSPWNVPLSAPARKVAAAFAAGCSIILKASEQTPATAVALVECLVDAGMPPGALNLVLGDPTTISSYLIASPVIRAVTFTGSVPVGKRLAALCGQAMKPAILELGGHSPVIVCEDVDAAAVARLAVPAKFRNAGQICTAPTRFIVHSKVYEPFVESFSQATRCIVVGNGLDDGVGMGPLIHARRLAAVQRMVDDAARRGAEVACGGWLIGNRGFFFEPTVLTGASGDAEVMNTESFGPIASMPRFDGLEDAVAVANRLAYGLCAFAFTHSAAVAHDLARRIESGMLSINHFGTSLPDTPFGGVKDSGYGREGGFESLDGYMVTRFVSHKMSI